MGKDQGKIEARVIVLRIAVLQIKKQVAYLNITKCNPISRCLYAD